MTDYLIDTFHHESNTYQPGEETHLEQHYQNLEDWTKERFPEFSEITHRWSGQILEPLDSCLC